MCIKSLHPSEDPRIGGRNRRRRQKPQTQRQTQPVERLAAAAAVDAARADADPLKPWSWAELGKWDAPPDFPPPQHRPGGGLRTPAWAAGGCADPGCADPGCEPGQAADGTYDDAESSDEDASLEAKIEATLGRTLSTIRSGEKGSGYGVEIVVGGLKHRIVQRPDGTKGVVEPGEFQRLDGLRQKDPKYNAAVRADVHWPVEDRSDCLCYFCLTEGGGDTDEEEHSEEEEEPPSEKPGGTRRSSSEVDLPRGEEAKDTDDDEDIDDSSDIWSDKEDDKDDGTSEDDIRAAVDDGRAEALLKEMLGPDVDVNEAMAMLRAAHLTDADDDGGGGGGAGGCSVEAPGGAKAASLSGGEDEGSEVVAAELASLGLGSDAEIDALAAQLDGLDPEDLPPMDGPEIDGDTALAMAMVDAMGGGQPPVCARELCGDDLCSCMRCTGVQPELEPELERLFAVGDTVEVSGLQGAPQHNFKHGIVQKFDGQKGRYVIKIRGLKKPLAVKPNNLTLLAPDLEPELEPEPEPELEGGDEELEQRQGGGEAARQQRLAQQAREQRLEAQLSADSVAALPTENFSVGSGGGSPGGAAGGSSPEQRSRSRRRAHRRKKK